MFIFQYHEGTLFNIPSGKWTHFTMSYTKRLSVLVHKDCAENKYLHFWGSSNTVYTEEKYFKKLRGKYCLKYHALGPMCKEIELSGCPVSNNISFTAAHSQDRQASFPSNHYHWLMDLYTLARDWRISWPFTKKEIAMPLTQFQHHRYVELILKETRKLPSYTH